MAQFIGDIAFILESFLLVAGLVILYVAIERKSSLLKFAGSLAIVISIIALICTSYYWFTYQLQGAFDTAHIQELQKN